MAHTYKSIDAEVQYDYTDEWYGGVVVTLERSDGIVGDVWVAAGVQPYQQGSAEATGGKGYQGEYQSVWMWGDCLQEWCPEQFEVLGGDGLRMDDDEIEAIMGACTVPALRAWSEYIGGSR